MTNEQIAIRAIENAETAAQFEVKDPELRNSLVRNFVQELNSLRTFAATPTREAMRKALQHAWDRSRDGFEIDTMTDAALAVSRPDRG